MNHKTHHTWQSRDHGTAGSTCDTSAVQFDSPLPLASTSSDTVAWTRALAVGSLLGLIVLGLAWELWLAPTGQRTLALKVLPLAVPMVGLLKRRMYTYRWVSLMVWLYFIEGVVRASGDHGIGRACAVVETLLCLLLFAACAVHVRYRLRTVPSGPT